MVAGDFNTDVSGSKGLIDNHFSELINTFKTTRGTLLNVLLTNNQIPKKKLVFVERD